MLHILQGGTNSILNMAKFHHFVNLAESANRDDSSTFLQMFTYIWSSKAPN
jgi:hypothetical protein